jgi:phosphoribosyl-dephospho-CoA transferase
MNSGRPNVQNQKQAIAGCETRYPFSRLLDLDVIRLPGLLWQIWQHPLQRAILARACIFKTTDEEWRVR